MLGGSDGWNPLASEKYPSPRLANVAPLPGPPGPASVINATVGANSEEDFDQRTINIAAVDDLATPVNDSASVDEDGTVVIDAVAKPVETPLLRAATAAGKTVVTGAQIATLQALEQFVLYTGVHPSDEQVAAAEAYALG